MDPSLRVRCACGWEAVGNEDKVVAATQDHGRRIHNMAATREQVLAMAVPDNAPSRIGRTRRPSATPTTRLGSSTRGGASHGRPPTERRSG